MSVSSPSNESNGNSEKRNERRAIAFLTIVVAPVVAVMFVAAFGFIVWMVQLIAGPPGM